MGSGFPTQNYWPQLHLGHCQPETEYFHHFMKPVFSDPNPRSQIGSSNRFRQRNILSQEICLQFKKGHCNYGANCVFPHINPTLVNTNTSFRSEERQDMINRSRVCYWGKECQYGDRCKFLHIRENVSDSVNGRKRRRSEDSGLDERYMEQKNVDWRKTKLCTNWTQSGTCIYGARCCYAHGEEELRQTHVMEPANAFCANNRGIVTKEAAVPHKKSSTTVYENRKKDGKYYFKWNSIEKISQVYADWIDDLSAPVQLAAVKYNRIWPAY